MSFNPECYLQGLTPFGYQVMKNVIKLSRENNENNFGDKQTLIMDRKQNLKKDNPHAEQISLNLIQFQSQCKRPSKVMDKDNAEVDSLLNIDSYLQEKDIEKFVTGKGICTDKSGATVEYSQDIFKTLLANQYPSTCEEDIVQDSDNSQYYNLFQSISLFTQETKDPNDMPNLKCDMNLEKNESYVFLAPDTPTIKKPNDPSSKMKTNENVSNIFQLREFLAPPKKPAHNIKSCEEMIITKTTIINENVKNDSTSKENYVSEDLFLVPEELRVNNANFADRHCILEKKVECTDSKEKCAPADKFDIKNISSDRPSLHDNEIIKKGDEKKCLHTLKIEKSYKNTSGKRLNQKKISDMLQAKKRKRNSISTKGIDSSSSNPKQKKLHKNINTWLGNIVNDPLDSELDDIMNSIEQMHGNSEIKKSDLEVKNIIVPSVAPSDGVQTVLASNEDGKMSFVKSHLPSALLSNSVIVSKKKSKFITTPLKKEVLKKNLTFEIENLDENCMSRLLEKTDNDIPLEINLTIVYREGFCQLDKIASSIEMVCSPTGILLYIKWEDLEKYFYLNLRGISMLEKQKLFIKKIMELNTRKICFEAQDLMMLLMDVYTFHRRETCLKWEFLDPKIGCFLLDPDNPPSSFCDVLTQLSLNVEFEIVSSSSKQKAARWLSLLSDSCQAMYSRLKECNIWQVFISLETKLVSVLSAMELRGICIDTKKLNEMESILNKHLNQIERDALTVVGKPFQLNSHLQLRNILFNELKLDVKHNIKIKETSVLGAKSTSEPVLRQLVPYHPLPRLVLNFRHIYKAKATFVDSILNQSKSGIIRTTWDQTSAATGRLTSCNPNLQAIPKRPFSLDVFPELGSEDTASMYLRNAFIARPSYSFVAADFQHIEFRVFAHMTEDITLIDFFHQEKDIFQALTRKWMNKNNSEEILPKDREKTKHIVYAFMYGAGHYKLMEILHMNNSQVSEIKSKFISLFPALRSFSNDVIQRCRTQNGVLQSISGRIRKLPHISSTNMGLRAQAERQAVNFVIQGSAADICKTAMIATEHRLSNLAESLDHHLILQIHDELVWEVPDNNVAKFKDLVREVMQHSGEFCGGLLVPLPVAISQGKSWGHMT